MSKKFIRIALTESDQVLFAKAKAAAEGTVGLVMTDSQFALGLIRNNIKA